MCSFVLAIIRNNNTLANFVTPNLLLFPLYKIRASSAESNIRQYLLVRNSSHWQTAGNS